MSNLNKRLLRKIKETLPQYIAVSLVVLIGIMMYLGLSTSMVNLEDSVDEFRTYTNSADIYVELDRIPIGAIKYVKQIENVKDVQGRILKDVPLITDTNEKIKLRLVSIPNKGADTINKLFYYRGKKSTSSKGISVGKSFFGARNMSLGDKLKVQINGFDYNLSVDSESASSEFIFPIEDPQVLVPNYKTFGIGYVSDEFARSAFGFGSDYNQLLIKVNDKEKIDTTIDAVEKKLKKYGVKSIYSYEDHMSYKIVSLKLEGGKKAAGVVPLIFLGVAAFIIAMTIDKLIKNDRMAIGVLKALGYSNQEIIVHYAMYSLGIGILGGSSGIYFGLKMADGFAKLFTENNFDIPTLVGKLDYKVVIYSIALTLIFCLGAGFIGSRKIMSINPAESMRPDPPKTGKIIFLEKIPWIWKKLKFSWKIVFKNILRSKRRFLFLVIGIALTFAVLQMPFYIYNSITVIFNDFYSNFLSMDYNVSFKAPLNESELIKIKEVISYTDISGKMDYPLIIRNKWKTKDVQTIGLKVDNNFYNLVDLKKERITIPKHGILLTKSLADTLEVKKGDYVYLSSYKDKDKEFKIKVKDLVDQSLGISAYMNIDTLRHYFYDKNMISGAYINSKDDVKEKLKDFNFISSILSIKDSADGFKEYLEIQIAMISVMVIFGGILGFVIVYNSTIITIKERQLEFSALRVMGFTKKEIFKTVLYENIIMVIVGIIIGIPLALNMGDSVGASMSSEVITLNAKAPPISYVYAGVLTIVFILLSQFATYEKIKKLNFIDALKNRMS
ncbi:ABC transporter permease [Helicovermis profundi]|uniref:FtsX-like permease family protein n=1 Tax=Helicovermis profundi TaxID=3065157 RepID=A0AAU9E646_9FIRM|nr:FtsX-like permease family protein [Clostridia bacterium S502]